MSGCSLLSPPSSQARTVLTDEIQTLDPARAQDPVSMELIPSLYETLYEVDYASDEYRVKPLLAADWPKFSTDGLIATVRLRSDVVFPDSPVFPGGKGRSLGAADVADSLKRIAWPQLQSPGWSYLRDRIVGLKDYRTGVQTTAQYASKVQGLEVVDSHTLRIHLLEPTPHLAWLLAQTWASVIPHESVTASGDEFGSPMGVAPGTGAFLVDYWVRAKKLRMVKNKQRRMEVFPSEFSTALRAQGFMAEHGRTLPFLDQVEFYFHPSLLKAWEEFREGRLDWVKLPVTHLGEVVTPKFDRLLPEWESKKYGLARTLGEKSDFIVFNFGDERLADRALRQALSYGINRKGWLERAAGGFGRELDPKRPTKLSPTAVAPKWKSGISAEMELTMDMPSSDPTALMIGEYLRDEWLKIGVRVNVLYNSFEEYRKKLREGRYQLAYVIWTSELPDPEDRLQLFYGRNSEDRTNFSGWRSPRFDSDFESARKLKIESPERRRKMQSLDALLDEELVRIVGITRYEVVLLSPKLRNYRPGELFRNRYRFLRLSQSLD